MRDRHAEVATDRKRSSPVPKKADDHPGESDGVKRTTRNPAKIRKCGRFLNFGDRTKEQTCDSSTRSLGDISQAFFHSVYLAPGSGVSFPLEDSEIWNISREGGVAGMFVHCTTWSEKYARTKSHRASIGSMHCLPGSIPATSWRTSCVSLAAHIYLFPFEKRMALPPEGNGAEE